MCRLMRYEVRGRKERKGGKKRKKKKNRTKSGGCTWPEKKIRILHLREFRWVRGSEVFFPKNTAVGCSWARHHKPQLTSRVPQKSAVGGALTCKCQYELVQRCLKNRPRKTARHDTESVNLQPSPLHLVHRQNRKRFELIHMQKKWLKQKHDWYSCPCRYLTRWNIGNDPQQLTFQPSKSVTVLLHLTVWFQDFKGDWGRSEKLCEANFSELGLEVLTTETARNNLPNRIHLWRLFHHSLTIKFQDRRKEAGVIKAGCKNVFFKKNK